MDGLQFPPWLACLASVSSRVRRESLVESEKKKQETLATQATPWLAFLLFLHSNGEEVGIGNRSLQTN